MPRPDAVKGPGPLVYEGWKRLGWMFVGVRGQRIKRFVFAKRLDPLRDVHAEFAAPGFNRQRYLGRPQQERRHYPKQQIVLPFVHLREAMQTLDCRGGWDAVAFEHPVQRGESSRDNWLPLDQQQRVHENVGSPDGRSPMQIWRISPKERATMASNGGKRNGR